jgi:hypothetical protein
MSKAKTGIVAFDRYWQERIDRLEDNARAADDEFHELYCATIALAEHVGKQDKLIATLTEFANNLLEQLDVVAKHTGAETNLKPRVTLAGRKGSK